MEFEGREQEFVLDAIFPPDTTQEHVRFCYIKLSVAAAFAVFAIDFD